jgi:hypothetical protein
LCGDIPQDDQDYIAIDTRQDIDYTDYEVWTSIDLESEIILNEISEQDRALLEQYQAMLNQVNGLVEQGLLQVEMQDGVLKYEPVIIEEDTSTIQQWQQGFGTLDNFRHNNTRGVSDLWNGKNSFKTVDFVQRFKIPVGMKWFAQIIYHEWDVYIPIGFETKLSIAVSAIVVIGLWAVKTLTGSVFPDMDTKGSKKGFKDLLKDLFKKGALEAGGWTIDRVVGINITTLYNLVKGVAMGALAVDAIMAASTGGLSAAISAFLRVALAVIASYLFNEVGKGLIEYIIRALPTLVTSNPKNTIRMNSNLVFFNNDFSLERN